MFRKLIKYQKFLLNRYRRSVQSSKAINETELLDTFLNGTAESHNRTKRQIAFGREQLCQVRTQFIQPQVALNNQGSWMYVVNQGQPVTQLVKSEVCA